MSDEEILSAYELLARDEGLFVEPASAAGVAGLLKMQQEGRLRGGVAVSILTGSGLKDPDSAMATYTPNVRKSEPGLESVRRTLGW